MHVYYKFGLFLIFILSVSNCSARVVTAATNKSASYDDEYNDDYDDYYDEADDSTVSVTTLVNRLKPTTTTTTTAATTPTTTSTTTTTTTTTTLSPLFSILEFSQIPPRSNHVLEPTCPKSCLCLEDYKYIQCANAHLRHVPRSIPSTTLIIDLSQNSIGNLRDDDFTNFTKVREINLSGNQLKEVRKEIFSGLRRLQRLRLDNNRIRHIQPDVFSDSTDLTMLDLSNNTIALRNNGSFLNQPGLLELSCRNCSWTQLYDNTFANLSKLTSLKLDHNDFSKKINTRAFTPLKNLIKLKLPELEAANVQELCNLLKSIDNISFKHFDVSCFELVLGASYNESLILATDPPYIAPSTLPTPRTTTTTTTTKAPLATRKPKLQSSAAANSQRNATTVNNMGTNDNSGGDEQFLNLTLPTATATGGVGAEANATLLSAGVLGGGVKTTEMTKAEEEGSKVYQVPISQEAINIMLIAIMIIAVVGIVIGIICRKDVGGIKTKCCRTRKPEPKDQVHPAEEIPLNKLA